MTDPAPVATGEPADLDYQARISFASRPHAVFEALTSLDKLAGWWTSVAGEGCVGGELRFDFEQSGPCVMHVDVADAPSRVQWTCIGYPPLPDWAGTTIRFALAERAGGGCDLDFSHHGLTPKLECFDDCRSGWDHFLPSLRSYVDTGTGWPWKSPADVERRRARDRVRTATTGD